jgi:hypothetical protein
MPRIGGKNDIIKDRNNLYHMMMSLKFSEINFILSYIVSTLIVRAFV